MAENTNMKITANAWAEIVLEHWLQQIWKLNIGTYRHDLEESFDVNVMGNENAVSQIRFMFNYYGKFVDMGVGAGIKLEDVKENAIDRRVGEGNPRRPKRWYSPVFYAQVRRLAEILGEKYGNLGVLGIIENLDDNALRWNETNL